MVALKGHAGLTVVQDPHDASVPEMPKSALNRMKPDHVVALSDMPALLGKLARQPAAQPALVSGVTRFEVQIARTGHGNMENMDHIGKRSVLTCPDCGGVMWEIDDGELARYRCHVGHAYSAEDMGLALDDTVRRGLAGAARALEERIALARKLSAQAAQHGRNHLAESWAEQEREAQRELTVIRDSVMRMDQIAGEISAA